MIRGPVRRILAKDFRRFWPLFLSAAVLDGIGVLMPFGRVNPNYFGEFSMANAVVFARWFVVAFVSVAMAQDDPPCGDRGSWLARPITPSSVLAAKAILLAIGLALPAGLAAGVAATMLHAGVGNLIAGALEVMAFVYFVGSAFLILGSITNSLLQAALAAISVFVLTILAASNLAALATFLRRPGPEISDFSTFPSDRTMHVVNPLFVAVTISIVIIHQYVTRRTGRTLLLCAITIPATWLTLKLWNWEIFPSHGSQERVPGLPTVELSCIDRQAFIGSVTRRSFPMRDGLVVTLRVHQSGGRPGAHIQIGEVRSRFQSVGGSPYVMPRPMNSYVSLVDLIANHSVEPDESVFNALGAAAKPLRSKDFSMGILELPRSTYDSVRGSRGKIDGYIRFGEYAYNTVASVPLRPGSSTDCDGRYWRLRSLFLLPKGTVVLTIDSMSLGYKPLEPGYCVLVNKVTREVSVPTSEAYLGNIETDFIKRASISMSFGRTWSLDSRARTVGIDEDWLANAEIEVLDSKRTGRSVMEIHWDDIKMPTNSPGSGS